MSMNGPPVGQVQLEVPAEMLPRFVPNVVYAIPVDTPEGRRVQVIAFTGVGQHIVFMSPDAARALAQQLTIAATGLIVA